jgi:DNA invertase Pin-like site-specific DNA recombinase
MALIGYARVSRHEQNLDLQLDALNKEGCSKIFTDKITGSTFEREGLDEALTYLREGDTLVVWRLDRLGRSLKDLIETLNSLHKSGIGFKSITEAIDTTTATGELVFHIFGALAQFERRLIQERTQAGLAAARARGKKGGRPKALDAKKAALAQKLYADKTTTIDEICTMLHIGRTTLYRYIHAKKAEQTTRHSVTG